MKFEIYCDESRQDLFTTKKEKKDKYLLIGGLWLPSYMRKPIKTKINELKQKNRLLNEFKWTKVSPNRSYFYQELIDVFMAFGLDLRFRCIAVEADKVNLELYHDNDHELGFYKFYYQLLNHWIHDFNEYRIFTDIKTNRVKRRLKTLHSILSNSNLYSKIVSVQALPSSEVVLIQLADFLLGAVSSKLNNSIKPEGTKYNIIERLENRLGREIEHTPRSEQKFNVFKINLTGGW